MLNHRKGLSFVPLGAAVILACLVFVSSLFLGAHHIDVAEQQREEQLIGQDVAPRVDDVSGRMNPFTLWDEAFRKLQGRLDKVWADENIGSLTKSIYYSRVLILDRADRPVYAKQTSRPVTPSDIGALVALAAPAIADVRKRESSPVGAALGTPVRANIIGLVEGRPALAIAALVRSDTGKVKSLFPRGPILVLQVSLDTNLRQTFAKRFLLDDLRIDTVRNQRNDGNAEVVLAKLPDGRRIVLTWTPQKPGATLLKRSAVFLVIAALCVAIAGVVAILHASRVTRKLVVSQAEARRLALEDPLTGLANRLLFTDRLEHAREQLKRGDHVLGILCLDLDRFKEVNDSLGHEAGDALLKEVGRRLNLMCRAEDTVARIGGDEFVILARSPEAAGASDLAARVVAVLSGSALLAAGEVTLSCSVGVTILVDPEVTQSEALRQADLALYRAKQSGRGQFCFFEPEMDARLKDRKALEIDLREAVRANTLTVAYQPLVDVAGRLSGVEALARWNHATRGEIEPSVFIPIAESTGLISSLADKVFERTCLAARDWGGLRVSVNISPVQLRLPGLIERFAATLEATGVSASQFDLEITEGVLLDDDARTHAVLAGLRRMGFSLVLDDFGKGYSSLSYLDKYPIQKIKLDGGFASRLPASRQARAIVAALLQMAEALSLRVSAEGIETAAQFEILRDMGCKEFQGFLFSQPTTPQAIRRLLEKIVSEPRHVEMADVCYVVSTDVAPDDQPICEAPPMNVLNDEIPIGSGHANEHAAFDRYAANTTVFS